MILWWFYQKFPGINISYFLLSALEVEFVDGVCTYKATASFFMFAKHSVFLIQP